MISSFKKANFPSRKMIFHLINLGLQEALCLEMCTIASKVACSVAHIELALLPSVNEFIMLSKRISSGLHCNRMRCFLFCFLTFHCNK